MLTRYVALVAVAVLATSVAGASGSAGAAEEPDREPASTSPAPAPEQGEDVSEGEAAEDSAAQYLPTAGIEEITITGEILEAPIEKETTSAVGFDESELRLERIQDVSDLSNFTPNLEIKTAFAASNPTLFIRGVGLDDYNANSASAVAVYQDGVYMNSPVGQLFQLYDVAGVTVLRGPQAQLRNANAGAILVQSHLPSEDLEAYGEVSYGNYNRVNAIGALNLPIVPQLANSRLAFTVNRGDGITENRCHDDAGDPTTQCRQALPESHLAKDVNNIDNWAARSLLEITPDLGPWVPTNLLLNFHGGQNNSLSSMFQHRGFKKGGLGIAKLVPAPDRYNYQDTDGNPFAGDYNAQGKEEISVAGGSLRASWPASENLEIGSLSAFEWHDRNTVANDDASPRVWFDHNNYRDNAWQFSQQLDLKWMAGDSTEVDAGGLFLMEDLEVNNLFPNERVGTFRPLIEQQYQQQTRGFSFWTQAQSGLPWAEDMPGFFSNFELAGTFRYSYESKDFDLHSSATRFTLTGHPIEVPQISEQVSDSWQGPSGDVTLTYHLGRHWESEDFNVYAKYSRGWKPGTFNGGTVFARQPVEPVDPETVDSFEVGLRTAWWDQRVGLDLTGFFYEFTDMQVFQLQQEVSGVPLPRLINAQKVNISGIELEFRAEPIDGLYVSLNAGWLDGKYNDFSTEIDEPAGSQNVITRVADYSGKTLLASPKWSASGYAQYQIPLGRFGWLQPRYSFSFKDDTYFDPNEGAGARDNLEPGTIGQKAYWLHNAMLSYLSPDERFELTGWVRNFTDQHYRVQSFDLTDPNFLFVLDAYGDPRTYGFTAVMRF